ncbi:type IV secretory pathway TraG/TraD family ATPase VirD4 [Kribbella aluminosa]|uniref:Type IV secretory pathway TraG/TraD family ATPase VirD4 n=1 Tax=Kribbella aluminosa TaxID=416017 RepID=A0ABS4UTK0_9ACTN|nr:TraG/TraD/VirD4 family protein [Kribbella aluminosa]MBP2354974.1 type IV secretory pathway TraG/TraD family ATPase VirD4 [Kribbella aluminosa]
MNAGPLVTALTAAIVKAAEDYAVTRPGGRLPVPMLGVLDEAANVCRWKDLPDLYSHYGSRGIVLDTILQSWAQGVACWGDRGMEKLWSAANRRLYGGGVDDVAFLERLAKIIGDHERLRGSTSTNKDGTSVSRSLQREQILDVSDLAALPAGRAIVFSSGSRATLIRTIPWMERPYADQIRASIAQFDPGARRTVAPNTAQNAAPHTTPSSTSYVPPTGEPS